MGTHQGSDQTHRGTWWRFLGTPGLGGQSAPPSLQSVSPHNLFDHSHGQALLEPTELAPVPTPLVHGAVLVRQTNVFGILLDGSFEETFAAFTSADAVVLAGGVVSADGAQKATGCATGCDVTAGAARGTKPTLSERGRRWAQRQTNLGDLRSTGKVEKRTGLFFKISNNFCFWLLTPMTCDVSVRL